MPPVLLSLLIACVPLMGLATLQYLLPVLGPLLTSAAGLQPQDYGWLGGAMGLGAVWFCISNHAITPVLGPVRTLRAGLLFAIAGLGLILTGVWPAMLAGALMIGFGYATTTPAGSQVLADSTPRAMWGTLFSLRQAAVPVGGILAGVIGTWVVPTHGWRAALEVVILVLALIGLALFLVPRRLDRNRPLQPFRAGALIDLGNLVRPFRFARRVAGLPSLIAAGCALGVAHCAVISFFVTYLVAGLDMPLQAAAALFALLQACAIGGRVLVGVIADRVGSPLPVLKLLAPLSAVSALLLGIFSPQWSPLVQWLAAIMIGLTVGTWNGLYLAEIARLSPAADVSDATAAASVFGFLTYTLTPPAFGILAGIIGYGDAFRAVALSSFLAGAILVVRRTAPAPAAPSRRVLRDVLAFSAGIALSILAALAMMRSGQVGRLAADAVETATPARALAKADSPDAGRQAAAAAIDALLAQGPVSPRGVPAAGASADQALRRADRALAGNGEGRDQAEAAYWLRHALQLRLDAVQLGWALTQLGSIHASPEPGAAPDHAAAHRLWEAAALAGDPVATCFLARLYAQGLGVAQDMRRAGQLQDRARRAGACQAADLTTAPPR
jgi:MFS family permease